MGQSGQRLGQGHAGFDSSRTRKSARDTRAINISAPAIRFHGTENIGSVGTAASHGCMRMYRTDIEDFYERVEVGKKVFIVP